MAALDGSQKRREELTARLRELDASFEREMRARGFDPAQAENMALTAELARLYAAREEIRTEIDDLSCPAEVKDQTQHD